MEKESAGFVGRRAEVAALDEALGRALRFNAPQTVTIIGADGLGKSRLCDEWLGAHQGEQLRIVRAAVDPAVGAGAVPPRGALIAHLLRVRFGLAELTPDEALLQFRAQLQEVFGDRRILELSTLLGRFLGFDLPESPLGSALAGRPEQGAELARAVLARFLEQDAAGRPVVIIGENLQDADDDSLAELESLAAELVDAPILIVATARPELLVRRPGWGRGGGNHTRIDLQPLTRMEIDLLVASFLASPLGPPALVPVGLGEQVAAESAGNPQLVGEVLRAYREHGILAGGPNSHVGERWRFDRDRAARQHPTATREEVAHARITVLTSAERDVLARAAIFGGEFWTGGVVALGRMNVAPPDEAAVFAPDPTITEIHQILESLRERGFVERVGKSSIPEETAWTFCQTIERRLLEADAASELTKRRKVFAAQWLESRGGEGREQRLEALARLYEEAGDARRAAYCFVTAAALARDHLLLDRAHALYMAGIRHLDLDDAVAKMDALYAAGDVAARLGRTRESVGLF
ncbi:MAG TPA: AAA family ATPase, partial [Polyangia bacterium]